ncbi:hypothetical protein [Flavobacterium sp. 102]|uniref:hypothetical protein n=1 Tax=Flavobacterium sp. 102 TaxID=2135623 RepID=UPI000F131A7C|nr:hypothetical protein [Flavobacterium sp. 102]RKS02873.1 hypothetical protein C8C84_2603 [Flavobacterium sp. 102]
MESIVINRRNCSNLQDVSSNIMRTPPEIDLQKKSEYSLHRDNIIREFPNTEFSNLTLKWVEIIQRIDNVNLLIKELFHDFDLINTKMSDNVIEDSVLKTPLFYRQKFLTEQIFYWIRKTLDEMIAMIYVLEYLKKTNKYPTNIKIESIGHLIGSKEFIVDIKDKHLNILKIINNISNTFKHSFLNSEIHNHLGELDPLVFSYGFKNNDMEKEMVFTAYKIEDVIVELNKLITDLISHIKQI